MSWALTEALRGDVAAPFAAAFPGITLVFDNGQVDWNNPPNPLVVFEVEFYDAEQVHLGAGSPIRDRGYVYVDVLERPQLGVKKVRQILDWFRDHLKYRVIAGAQLQVPVPEDRGSAKGWYCRGLKVAFHATGP